MSGRGKFAPLGVILVLIVCACNLAVHFFVEGWSTQVQGPIFDVTVESGDFDYDLEHTENHFVLNSMSLHGQDGLPASVILQSQFCSSSVHISPLLPPPNI
jgi:hypothetical protein